MRTGDLVIATAACPVDGATTTYLHGEAYAPAADFALTRALVDAADAAGIQARTGLVASVDVFYNTDDDYASRWLNLGPYSASLCAAAVIIIFTAINVAVIHMGRTTQRALTLLELTGLCADCDTTADERGEGPSCRWEPDHRGSRDRARSCAN